MTPAQTKWDETREKIKKQKEEAAAKEAALTEQVEQERSLATTNGHSVLPVPAVEGSRSLSQAGVQRNMAVVGLEDVPTSMIPVPFYKLVQPGSTNVTTSEGKDANPGSFLMGDTGEEVDELSFVMLRAKRQNRQNEKGETLTTMGVLGVNLVRMTPFIISFSVTAFSNFGQLMAQIKERGLKMAWEYPISVTTIKREEKKQTNNGLQLVKWYVPVFKLGTEPIPKVDMEMLNNIYFENASKLDRQSDQELQNNVQNVMGGHVNNDDVPF